MILSDFNISNYFYLSIRASSVPAECQNSIAKHIFDERENLSDPVFKAEICCKAWIKLFRSINIKLPQVYELSYSKIELEEMAKEDTVIECLLKSM